MVKHLITWGEKAFVFPQVPRNMDNDSHSSGWIEWKKMNKNRVDLKNPVADFKLSDINIHQLTEINELKQYLADFVPDESGIYYIYIRDRIKLDPPSKKLKKKRSGRIIRTKGRPRYSRAKLQKLGIKNKPRQKKMEVWNCIAKIEVVNGTVRKIFEKKGRSEHPKKPFTKKKYELLKKLEENKRRLF